MIIRVRGPLTISDMSNLAKPPSAAYLAADVSSLQKGISNYLPLPCVAANAQSKPS